MELFKTFLCFLIVMISFNVIHPLQACKRDAIDELADAPLPKKQKSQYCPEELYKIAKNNPSEIANDSELQTLLIDALYEQKLYLRSDVILNVIPNFIRRSVFDRKLTAILIALNDINCPNDLVTKVTREAENGNAEAQCLLGIMYYEGRGVDHNDETAVKWLTTAADSGYARAFYNLGLMHRQGWKNHTESKRVLDYKEAYQYYQDAAASGLAIAQARLGEMYEYYATGMDYGDDVFCQYDDLQDSNDFPSLHDFWDGPFLGLNQFLYEDLVVQQYRKAINKSCMIAIYGFGRIQKSKVHKALAKSCGYKEYREDYNWIQSQRRSSQLESLCHPVQQYRKGKECQKDNKSEEAIEWYTKSAHQGYSLAEFKLGMMHAQGWKKINNTKQLPDLETANKWFEKVEERRYRGIAAYVQNRLSDAFKKGWKRIDGTQQLPDYGRSIKGYLNKYSSTWPQEADEAKEKIKKLFTFEFKRNDTNKNAGKVRYTFEFESNDTIPSFFHLSEGLWSTIVDHHSAACAWARMFDPNITDRNFKDTKGNSCLHACYKMLCNDLEEFIFNIFLINNPGFCISCVQTREGYNICKINTESCFGRYFYIRGRNLLCFGDDNVRAAAQLLPLLEKMTNYTELDGAIGYYQAHKDAFSADNEEVRQEYETSIQALIQIKSDLKKAADAVYQELTTQTDRRDAIFSHQYYGNFTQPYGTMPYRTMPYGTMNEDEKGDTKFFLYSFELDTECIETNAQANSFFPVNLLSNIEDYKTRAKGYIAKAKVWGGLVKPNNTSNGLADIATNPYLYDCCEILGKDISKFFSNLQYLNSAGFAISCLIIKNEFKITKSKPHENFIRYFNILNHNLLCYGKENVKAAAQLVPLLDKMKNYTVLDKAIGYYQAKKDNLPLDKQKDRQKYEKSIQALTQIKTGLKEAADEIHEELIKNVNRRNVIFYKKYSEMGKINIWRKEITEQSPA